MAEPRSVEVAEAVVVDMGVVGGGSCDAVLLLSSHSIVTWLRMS